MEKQQKETQANNPLHGVKLVDILEHLVAVYDWSELGHRINIRCFKYNPNIKSSLAFLRKTPWAREKVEQLYLKSLKKKAPSIKNRLKKR
ncbi:VF530 family protein [Reichenbachiella ulvae]|uniref:VF530 family protein n=1 Tax=Reichenbachiella ulvae TaxID=2980104 RepID=A0ABT3CV33_9BACT|nr:VF530 family protein [Reichenbachiella ulvae]MCV9387551.1 VF530 family protein [Reichenbachiella ulvae]